MTDRLATPLLNPLLLWTALVAETLVFIYAFRPLLMMFAAATLAWLLAKSGLRLPFRLGRVPAQQGS